MQINKNKKIPKIVLIVACSLVVVAIAAGVYTLFFTSPQNNFDGTAGISKINYNPPTAEEKQAGNEQKEAVIEQDKRDQQNTPNKTAEVVISDASYYSESSMVEVRAYVTNVYEDGGECTAVLTQNGQSVTLSSTGFKDAKTTQCGAINIPRSKFSKGGSWKLVLTYRSPSTEGNKEATVQL